MADSGQANPTGWNGVPSHRVQRVMSALEPIAALLQPPYVHWVGGSDHGNDWCGPCCEKEVAHLRSEDPSGEYWVDGGWGVEESDTCVHCEGCGCLLDYALTRYGVGEELEHFSVPENIDATPETISHIYRVLSAVEWSDDKTLVRSALRLGVRAIRAVTSKSEGER